MLIEPSAEAAGICGRDQDGTGAQHEGQREQQRWRHPVRSGQRGERRTCGGHAGEDRDQQLDPVEDIRQHAAYEREQALLTSAAIHSVRNSPIRDGAQVNEAEPGPAIPRFSSFG
jgi:hypothetical protein